MRSRPGEAMAKRVSVDRWIFGVTLLLVFLGLVMIFSASAVMSSASSRWISPIPAPEPNVQVSGLP